MGRRIMFTEEQMNYIMECNGVNPNILNEEGEGANAGIGGATSTTSCGDYEYVGQSFDTKKDKKFWKDSLVHQVPGGISMEKK